LGSDPQNSRQILADFGQKPMNFWNFACFGEILSLFQKPNRTNPENSGHTDGPIRKIPDRIWRKLKPLLARAVRLRLFEDSVRRTTAYSTVRWRTTVVMRLEGGCHVGHQISAQYAVNAVNTRGHVIVYDVLDMPRGPLTLPNGHVDPTAHINAPHRTFLLQAISRVSYFPPPKATSTSLQIHIRCF
jgi:hypothetical protein